MYQFNVLTDHSVQAVGTNTDCMSCMFRLSLGYFHTWISDTKFDIHRNTDID